MKLRQEELLTALRPPEGRCLGALFCTRSFDESFFESILAAILPVHADPVFDRDLFLREARARLREVPIVVTANRTSYRGGHRLPFDLCLPPADISLHANLALILYEDHCRFMIGSANLTDDGFAGHGELMALKRLSYRSDAALLRQITAFIDGLDGGRGTRSEAWVQLKAQLLAVVGPVSKGDARSTLLASRGKKTVLEQFLRAIPKSARVQSIGLARGFLPIDGAGKRDSVVRRLDRWLSSRKIRDIPFDLLLRWPNEVDNVELDDDEPTTPDIQPGSILAQRLGEAGCETVRWLKVERVGRKKITCHSGSERVVIDKSMVALAPSAEPPVVWPVPTAEAIGPVDAITRLASRQDVRWWLFPETRIVNGVRGRQPLHARALVINTRQRGKARTHILVGGLSAEPGATERLVEAGIHMVEARPAAIAGLLNGIVPTGDDLYLEDDVAPPEVPSHPCPLEHVTYDASRRVLKLSWPASLRSIRAVYRRSETDDVLVDGRPGIDMSIPDFTLATTSNEVVVSTGDEYWNEPIQVLNIAALSAGESDVSSFSEIVAALGEASGSTRGTVGDLRADGDEAATITSLNPRHAFETLSMLPMDLARAGPSLGAFSFVLDGPLGMGRLADLLLHWQEDPNLLPGEAWVYACELLRVAKTFPTEPTPLGRAKKELLRNFVARMEPTVTELRPSVDWAGAVDAFYAGPGTSGRSRS